jgi:hypothetical protein
VRAGGVQQQKMTRIRPITADECVKHDITSKW